jgi:hypothetical protein
MSKTSLTKPPALGVLMGASITLAASAVAGSPSWFSGGFATGGNDSAGPAQALLAQTDDAVSAQLKADAENCNQLGIGASIRTAIGAHAQMAAATPDVEILFDVNDDCFSSVSQIIDLSSLIPGVGPILSAAQDAVLKYAQKKVCSAVGKVSGMVTSPINQTISGWNQLGTQFTDISGMGNSAIGGAISPIDPQLGAAYKPTSSGRTYTVNTNPFGASQTVFTGGSTGTPQAAATAQPQTDNQPATTASQSFTSWASNLFN